MTFRLTAPINRFHCQNVNVFQNLRIRGPGTELTITAHVEQLDDRFSHFDQCK